jgi:hypothetical protein
VKGGQPAAHRDRGAARKDRQEIVRTGPRKRSAPLMARQTVPERGRGIPGEQSEAPGMPTLRGRRVVPTALRPGTREKRDARGSSKNRTRESAAIKRLRHVSETTGQGKAMNRTEKNRFVPENALATGGKRECRPHAVHTDQEGRPIARGDGILNHVAR